MGRPRLLEVPVRTPWHQTKQGCWSLTLGTRSCRVRVLQLKPGGAFLRRTWIPGTGWSQAALHTTHRPEAEARAEAFLRNLRSAATPSRAPRPAVTLHTLWTRYQEEAPRYQTNIPRVQGEKAARMQLLELGLGAATPVEQLTLDAIDHYVALRRRGTGWPDGRTTEAVGARTAAQDLALLRAMIRWACTVREPDGTWLLSENPLRGMRLPVESSPKRPVATYERFLAVRAAIATLAAEADAEAGVLARSAPAAARQVQRARDRRSTWLRLELALVLAEATGRRIGAIAGLRWSDITLDPPAITWRKAFDKRRREATVPVPAVLVEEVVRTRARLGAFEDGWLFPKDSDPTARWHPKRFDALLRQAEQKAKVSPLPGGLWHPYRRKWATERKHLPAVDVMAAGGWKNRSVLETCYQQATTEAVLEVMASPVKLRELRERKVSGNS